jgi:D-sedoheptulose 7-phosphate isomerase
MKLQNRIINHFTDSMRTQQDSLAELCELIELAAQRIVSTLLSDGKIFTCGNGRSATNANLLAASLLNQYERDRPPLPAIALSADATTITSIANEYRYEEVFSKPIRALGQTGDLLVTYTDGNHSANIAKAIVAAHGKDISIIVLCGEKSETITSILNERDLEIRVPSSSQIHTQEVHVLITHCLCDLIDHQLFDSIS